jgi:ribonucleoside-triphosphate reductase
MEEFKSVIKRNGKIVDYDRNKIKTVVRNSGLTDEDKLEEFTLEVEKRLLIENESVDHQGIFDVELIQDIIIHLLGLLGYKNEQNEYKRYKKEREKIRQSKSDLLKVVHSLGVETDRDNGNVGNNFSAKLLRIASETNKCTNLALNIPKHLAKPHENHDYHTHDLDSYNLTTNCLHNDTGAILKRGFNTGYGWIKPPKRIESAANLTCIIIQSLQNDFYGGQSCVDIDNDLGEYVEPTRQEIIERLEPTRKYVPEDVFNDTVERMLDEQIHQAAQNICYNLNTMHSRAGQDDLAVLDRNI